MTARKKKKKPPSTPPGNITEQAIALPLTDKNKGHLTQASKQMDLHAQHLHKAPGKKAWHYFFEFLMLFLAVTLGFFTENQRERFLEKRKAKDYAQSLYDDLKVDTFTIQRTINEKQWISKKFDSALTILETNTLDENNEFIYYVGRYLSFTDAFTSQDVTYQQLKSSGNFRYFDNVELYKKTANYYNLVSRYQLLDQYGPVKNERLPELETVLFNPKDFYSICMDAEGGTFYDMKRPLTKLHPITKDKQNLHLLYFEIVRTKDNANGSIIFLSWLKEVSTNLILDLKKEYRFL